MSKSAETIFLGLEPDARLGEAVCSYKRRVLDLVGPQLFLDHPPHLTLYLAAFDDADAVIAAAERIAAALPPIAALVTGWHTFWSDPLTGRHTLVCQLDASAVRELRSVQAQVIESVAAIRNSAATQSRYASRFGQLSSTEQTSIARTGFPYTGEHWHPHVTIASIAAADWPAIEREILPDAPRLAGSLLTLTCFKLIDEHPMPMLRSP